MKLPVDLTATGEVISAAIGGTAPGKRERHLPSTRARPLGTIGKSRTVEYK